MTDKNVKVTYKSPSSSYGPSTTPKNQPHPKSTTTSPFHELTTLSFLTTFLLHDITTREIIFNPDTVHETPKLLTLQRVAEREYVKPKDLANEPFQRFIMMLWLKQYDITPEDAFNTLRAVWKEAGKLRVSAAGERGKHKYESRKGWEKLTTLFEADDALEQEEEED
ncbi:hypothetical protein RUND412_009981 [Rhizina undulata]